MGKKLLVLNQVVRDRDTVEIQGKDYEVAGQGDLGPIDQARAKLAYNRLTAIDGDNPTEEELQLAEKAFDTFLKMMLLGITDEVIAGMSGGEKMAIFQAFMEAAQAKQAQAAQKQIPSPQHQRQVQAQRLPQGQAQGQGKNRPAKARY